MIRMRQGIAPCLGIAEALVLVDFFLILGPAIGSQLSSKRRLGTSAQRGAASKHYFLNKLSNAARASFALRGAGMMLPLATGDCAAGPAGAASRATVTRGENNSQVLAWSFTAIRVGIGFRHWKRVEESKFTHCLQQCRGAPHLGHLPVKSVSGESATEQLKHRAAAMVCTNLGNFGPVTSKGNFGPAGLGRSERCESPLRSES